MSAKDLNLSLDRKLAQAETPGKAKSAGVLKRGRFGRLSSVPEAADDTHKARPRKPLASGSPGAANAARHWLAPALIALVNMLFLVLAGIWLTGTRFPLESGRAAGGGIEQQEAPALGRMQTQLDVMQEQLLRLQSTLEEQQRLLLFSRLEATQAAAPGAEDAPPEDTASEPMTPPGWQIHLGHFATPEAAATLQRDLGSLGYAAEVAASSEPGDSGVSLLLGGFSDRKMAELTAKDIMQSTRLNGLWVSIEE